MEQDSFLPFSSVVASLLLYKRKVTGVEVINFISLLSQENIFISDEEDEYMNSLMICIDCYNYDYFEIKESLDYDSYLFNDVTVKEFLYSKSSLGVLNFINRLMFFEEKDIISNEPIRILKQKKKVKFFSNIFKFKG